MKKYAFIVLFFIGVDLVAQQDVFLSVQVNDSTYNKPLIGAAIQIQPGKITGVTDNNGLFSIRLKPDNYLLEITYLGFEPVIKTLNLDSSVQLNLTLNPGKFALKEITVRGEALARLSSDYISQAALEKLPAYLGEVDPLKSIQILPGVVTPTEGNTGLFVRGSDAGQSLVVFDGVPLYSPGHLYNFFSVFNSDMLQGITLHKGNIPSSFNSRGSAVLEIKSKIADLEKPQIQGGLGLLSSKFYTSIPLIKNRWGIAFSGRRTYADLLLPLFNPPNLIIKKDGFHFYDLNLQMPVKINQHSTIMLSAYQGADLFEFFDGTRQDFRNRFSSIRYTTRWGENHRSSLEMLYYYSDFFITYQKSVENLAGIKLDKDHRQTGLQIHLTSPLSDRTELAYGYQFQRTGYFPTPYHNPNIANDTEIISLQQRSADLHAFYADMRVSVGDFIIEGGARIQQHLAKGPANQISFNDNRWIVENIQDTLTYHHNEIMGTYFHFNPRIHIRYLLSHQWRIFAGVHQIHSPIQSVSTSTAAAPWDYYLLADNRIKSLDVWHMSGGISHNIRHPNLNVELTGYYKIMNHVAEYKDNIQVLDNSPPELLFSQGKASAYGSEFSLSINQYRYQGFLSYTLGKVTYEIPGVNQNRPYAPGHDIRHQFTVSQSLKLSPLWELAFQWTYHSGTPVDLPDGIIMVENTPVLYLDQKQKNSDKMPAYHRGDLLLKWTPGRLNQKRWKSSWSFSVYNIYGRKNPFFYNYREATGKGFAAFDGYMREKYIFNPRKVYLFYITPSISYHFKF